MSASEPAVARGARGGAMRAAGRTALRCGGARVGRMNRRPRSRRILLLALPHALPRWFDSEAAHDLEATFELRIGDPGAAPATFAVTVSEQRCAVHRGPAPKPGATVTIGGEDVVRVATGSVGWPELMSSGRLALSGDPFLALRFPSLFRLPVGAAR